MDTEEAVELVVSGRFKDLSPEDLMLIKDVLSASADPRAVQALMTLQNSPAGMNMPQAAVELNGLIQTNAQTVANIENGFNLFELGKDGKPVHSEILPVFNFFARVQVENRPEAEPVSGRDLFLQAAEVAKTTAKKDLFLDKNLSKHKPEEQKKNYVNAVLMAMEENAFVLVSNQIVENMTAKRKGPLSEAEKEKVGNIAEKRFAAIINPESQIRFKLSNSNIIGTTIAEINRNDNFAEMIQKNTGSVKLMEEQQKLDNTLAPIYPKAYQFLRPLAKASNLALLVGNVGKTTFTADKIAAAVHSSNPAKAQKEISLFAFLKEQPSKLKSFSRTIMASVKKAYNHVYEAMVSGLDNHKITAGFKKMFAYFAASKGNNAKYNGVGRKTIDSNLKIMSANASRILNQPEADKRIIAWKDFRNTFHNSQLGRAMALNPLNPERTTLVSERQEDYTKVTTIVLPSKQQPKTDSVIKKMIKAPIKAVAQSR